jgi:hypothetical protein
LAGLTEEVTIDSFDEKLVCHVHRTAYDSAAGLGVLHIGAGECADMAGCIQHFKRVDPSIRQINVIAGGFLSMRYLWADDRWVATENPPPPRPARSGLRPAVVATFAGDGRVTFA